MSHENIWGIWKASLTFSKPRARINVKLTFHRGGHVKNILDELRKRRGMTQDELAEQLEVSRQTICSLEKGRYNPSILLAFKISRFFGIGIEEIFLYEEGSL